MVIHGRPGRTRRQAFLAVDLMVAMAVILIALVPVAWSFAREGKLARKYYERAVALELVDGEFEVLQAGAWRAYAPGVHPYAVRGRAAMNLPPGRFTLTVSPGTIRLEWRPQERGSSPVVREGLAR